MTPAQCCRCALSIVSCHRFPSCCETAIIVQLWRVAEPGIAVSVLQLWSSACILPGKYNGEEAHFAKGPAEVSGCATATAAGSCDGAAIGRGAAIFVHATASRSGATATATTTVGASAATAAVGSAAAIGAAAPATATPTADSAKAALSIADRHR